MTETMRQLSLSHREPICRCSALRGVALVLAAALGSSIPAAAQQEAQPALELQGHLSDVVMGDYTVRSNYAVTVSFDQTIRFWNVTDGTEIRQYEGHTGPVYSVGADPRGLLIASGAQDNTVRLWEVPQTKPMLEFAGHMGIPQGVSISPTGRWMLSSDSTGKFTLRDRLSLLTAAGVQSPDQPVPRSVHTAPATASAWRTDDQLFATSDSSGRIIFGSPLLLGNQGELQGSSESVVGLGFSSNNQQLYSTSNDGIIRVWQLPAPPQRTLAPATAAITSFVVTSNQPTALAAAADGTLRLYDVNNGVVSRELAKQPRVIREMALQPAGQLLATIDDQSVLRVLNLADGATQGVLAGYTGALNRVLFHPGNQQLLTSGEDGLVRLWKLPVATIDTPGHTQPPTHIVSANNGQWFATASPDLTIRIWAANGQAQRALQGHTAKISALAVRFDDAQIASASDTGMIRLWNAGNAQQEAAIIGHPGQVQALGYERDNTAMLSADSDGLIRRWQLPITAPQPIAGHASTTYALAVSPDSSLVLSGSEDKTVRLWNYGNGQAVRNFAGLDVVVRSVCFSPDGSFVAAAGEGGRICVWATADGSLRHRRTAAGGNVTGLAFLGGNNSLASVDSTQSLKVWALPAPGEESPEDTAPVQAVQLPDAGVSKIRISANGATLYTSAGGGPIRTWNVAEGKLAAEAPVGALGGRTGNLTDLCISGDGNRLASCSDDGSVAFWDLQNPAAAPRTAKLSGPARSVALSRDGARLLVGLDKGLSALLTTDTLSVLQHFSIEATVTTAVCLNADGTRAITAGNIPAMSLFVPSVNRLYQGADAAISQLAITTDPPGIAAVTANASKVYRWNTAAEALPPIALPAQGKTLISADREGKQLLAAIAEGRTLLWPLADPAQGKTADTAQPRPATHVSLNRDGTLVAIADGTNAVRIHAAATGRQVERIDFARAMTGAAWTGPEGNLLACIGADNNISVAAPSFLRALDCEAQPQPALAMSTDGARVFSGSNDGKVRQWILNEGREERAIAAHTAPVTDLAFAPNGQYFASSSDDKTVKVWNIGNGELQADLPHPGKVLSVSIRSDSLRLSSTAEDGIVRVWDVATATLLETFHASDNKGGIARWMNDGQTVVISGGTPSLQTNRTSVLRAVRVDTADAVQRMELLAGGAQALTLSADGSVHLTDTNNGNLIRKYELPAAARAIAVRADNQAIAVGLDSGLVQVINPGNGTVVQELPHEQAITALAWSADNQRLAIASADSLLTIYGPVIPPAQAEPGVSLYLHEKIRTNTPLQTLQYTDQNRQLLATQEPGTITQWKTAQPTQVRQFNHGGAVYAVAISSDGNTIVSGSADQTVRVWDAETGQQRFQMNGHVGAVHSLAISPDGALVLTSGADRSLRLWDAVGGRQLKQLATTSETMYSVAIHPDGQIAAAAGADRKIHLYQLLTGAEIRTLEGHTDYIHSIRFSPNGNSLMSYGYAGQLRIWNVADGAERYAARVGRVGNYASYAFDGSQALLSNGDGVARIFDIPANAR